MTNLRTFTREQRIYLALWRKAAEKPDKALELTLSSQALALTAKMNLYRTIRPFREQKMFDKELQFVSENFTVSTRPADPKEPKGKYIVSISPRKVLKELDGMLELLDISEDDLILPEEKVELGKLSDFVEGSREALEDDLPAPKRIEDSTPFY